MFPALEPGPTTTDTRVQLIEIVAGRDEDPGELLSLQQLWDIDENAPYDRYRHNGCSGYTRLTRRRTLLRWIRFLR